MPWSNREAGKAGTVHLGGDYAEIAATERDIHAGRMPERPFVLVGQQYLADPGRSVGNTHPLWTYAHVPHGYSGDATEAIIGQIERFAPGFRERIVGQSVRSTTQMSVYNANYVGGDIVTGAKDIRQLVFGPRTTLSPYRIRHTRHVHVLGRDTAGTGRARDVWCQCRGAGVDVLFTEEEVRLAKLITSRPDTNDANDRANEINIGERCWVRSRVGESALSMAAGTANLTKLATEMLARPARGECHCRRRRRRGTFRLPGARRFAAQSWPIDRMKRVGDANGATLHTGAVKTSIGRPPDFRRGDRPLRGLRSLEQGDRGSRRLPLCPQRRRARPVPALA